MTSSNIRVHKVAREGYRTTCGGTATNGDNYVINRKAICRKKDYLCSWVKGPITKSESGREFVMDRALEG